MYRVVLIYAVFFISCQNQPEYYQVEDGVSEALAIARKKQTGKVKYNLSITLPGEQAEPIHAKLNLQVELLDTSSPLILDFSPDNDTPVSLIIDEDTVPVIRKNQHIVIPGKYLNQGANSIDIDFQAGDGSMNRNGDFMYTLVVPDRSRTIYPCFDQPDIKARYQLELTTPKDWKVLSATTPDKMVEEGEFVTHFFPESDLMSPYVFSFVAGKYSESELGEYRFLYRETDTSKINASLPVVQKLHSSAKEFLEEYTNYRFAFQKLDFVAIPGLQFGAMEHVGTIQYSQDNFIFNHDMPLVLRLTRAKTIAHEVAHMWFGNLVTMKWFNDVWLKEVFANFMADKIINPNFPEINHKLNFLTSHLPKAYNVDRTQGSNPIRQKLDNLKDAGSMYGNIIYNKAPVMMRQLELILGEEHFKEGVREYIHKFAFDNATWNDLILIFDRRTDIDLHKWSEVWVNQSGRPIFSSEIKYQNGEISSFRINQQAEDGSGKYWPQTFEVTLIYKDSISTLSVDIRGKSQEVSEFIGLLKPENIFYNTDGYGYGIFPFDESLISDFQLTDEVGRAQNYINLYENVLAGNYSGDRAMKAFATGLERENEDLIIPLINGYINSIFWKFLNSEQRTEWQPKLESLFWSRLQEDLEAPVKKPIFNTFSEIAYEGEGLERLYKLWNGEIVIDNLLLREDDKTNLAMKLAIYQHPKANEILAAAKQQITNQDNKLRFEFLKPALSDDPKVRQEFFESFKNADKRAKESWVQAACGYIHHPLRQKEAVKYLEISLELLEEIQKTGDIFFPKNWLDATIGQYQAAEAEQLLVKYLSEHPDLNPQLVSKLMQSADDLIRYQTMVKQ